MSKKRETKVNLEFSELSLIDFIKVYFGNTKMGLIHCKVFLDILLEKNISKLNSVEEILRIEEEYNKDLEYLTNERQNQSNQDVENDLYMSRVFTILQKVFVLAWLVDTRVVYRWKLESIKKENEEIKKRRQEKNLIREIEKKHREEIESIREKADARQERLYSLFDKVLDDHLKATLSSNKMLKEYKLKLDFFEIKYTSDLIFLKAIIFHIKNDGTYIGSLESILKNEPGLRIYLQQDYENQFGRWRLENGDGVDFLTNLIHSSPEFR